MQDVQLSDDTTWMVAVDDVVDGAFDEDGVWNITCLLAAANDHESGTWNGYYSSWVLCNEPPVCDPHAPRRQPWAGSATMLPLEVERMRRPIFGG